jgi:hypothetical protein
VAVTMALLLLSYKLAFQKTLGAWRTNTQLKSELEQVADIRYQPDYLMRKNVNLTRIIDLYKSDTIAFRNNSLSTISIIADKQNVKLSEVPLQEPILHTNNLIIQKLNFEGDFFALTKTINALQTANNIGVIRSVSYKLTKGQTNTNDKRLVGEVYFEIVK